ncbi:MAG TPA: prolyl oligopeptidase family serine peptidase, partial [Arenicellales bacterium]|nr:prolyl oligopeptidase family serine peptidase [Arenicellales bacterium]
HVTVWLSRSGRWLFIDSGGNTSSEARVVPAGDPRAEPVLLIPRRDDVEYSVDHHGERFLVLINDTHENFRLLAFAAPPDGSGPYAELIPADDRVTLEYVDAYRSHWIIGELEDGVRRIAVMDPASGERHYLPGSGPLASLDVEDLYDFDADYLRYQYSTPVSPDSVYDYDVASGRSTLRKVAAPPGYQPGAYAVERLAAPSGSVEVPLTVLYRRDQAPFGQTTPLLLTGYGAYEESAEMDFDSDLLSLLDRGVVVATAHVRGGGDLGPGWHAAGRMADKENSFSDFLACADHLIHSGYTGAGRIAAWGASAGGLLVAVAAQRRPELFASVVLDVPFLDVLNTLLDTDLPLTEHDFDEFGNPAVEEEYRWIRAYSPYDNIREQVYPPMLITTAMNDQRVGYWEALKWTARLRTTRRGDSPLLLKVDETGHLGRSGRYEVIEETAIVYTFLLDMWGLTVEPA